MQRAVSESQLDQRHLAFVRLLDDVDRNIDRGRFDAAGQLAGLAAFHATWRHNGTFVSPELESSLARLAERGLGAPPDVTRVPSSPAHVLHICSDVAGLAGMQHLIVRWIESDAGHRHSVAVTRPSRWDPPERLRRAITSRGGDLHRIGDEVGQLLDRADAIRSLVATADFVVLHMETHDVVPVIALAGARSKPPTLLVNHADHCFWIGTSVSDVVVNLRDAGRDVCSERRGLSSTQLAVLPTPIESPGAGPTARAARRQLGLDDDAVVLLSVARAPKFEAGERPHFAEIHAPVLERHPNACLLAVGPVEDVRWRRASDQVGGRIRALGPRDDVPTFMAAADIYVDSFPMVSITSLLEAGSSGLPLTTLNAFGPGSGVWSATAPGLDPVIRLCTDVDEYVEQLSQLVGSPAERIDLGQRTKSMILEHHSGSGWSSSLESLYEVARQASDRPRTTLPVERRVDSLDLLTAELLTALDSTQAYLEFRGHLPPLLLERALWRSWPDERRRLLGFRVRRTVRAIRLRSTRLLRRWWNRVPSRWKNAVG